MKIGFAVIAALSAAAIGGCAKNADQVAAAYVSPILYESYTCPQLAEEAQRVSMRAAQAAGVQDNKASGDAVAMGVGLVILWPTLFLIKGNDETTQELARLKGSMEAIEQASVKKRCGIQFQRPAPQPAPMARAETF